jgi:solute carrier family 8 (sodium/calcium exchanger)
VPIIDDSDWNPDLDFFVELYDPATMNRLVGEDTRTKVTILDEDFPGTIGFASTDIRVATNQEWVEIKLVRNDGADGNISCMFETEPLYDSNAAGNAQAYDDYVPKHEKVSFLHSETEQTIKIQLV